MLSRTLTATLKTASSTFPAIVLTGPRQSGKTTLLLAEFGSTHRYANLEHLPTRQLAQTDPQGFLAGNPPPVIIDEIQYAPDLLSYIKVKIDINRTPGLWLLTGSQNFALMKGVSQSLAGRAAVVSLLPLSLQETAGSGRQSLSIDQLFPNLNHLTNPPTLDLDQIILRGGYPEIAANPKVDRQLWFNSYLNTYLERDIRNLKQVGDLSQFERFVTACAIRTGQILDLASLASDLGVSGPTARRWLSLLETGYQVFLLYPHYQNLGKRLVKRPKLYFTDTGLASFLMGIHSPETLHGSSQYGALFETLVISDLLKRYLHHGQLPRLSYLRTRDGLEIDLIIEISTKLVFLEIKSSATITSSHARPLSRLNPPETMGKYIISASPSSYPATRDVYNYSWSDLLLS